MIVITDVKIIKVDENPCILDKYNHNFFSAEPCNINDMYITRQSEFVKGRRFINREKGIDVIIGVSNEAGKLLGIQYEAFQGLEHQIQDLRSQLEVANDFKRIYMEKIKILEKSSLLKRLKYLFTGIKI